MPDRKPPPLSDSRPSAPPPALEEVDLWKQARKLWNRKFALLGLALLLFAPTAYVILKLPPKYHAVAIVLIDDRKADIINLKDVLSGIPMSDDTTQSEIEVITSRDLGKKVVQKLALASDPEFNPSLEPDSDFVRMTKDMAERLARAGIRLPFFPTEERSTDDAGYPSTAVLNRYLQDLSVAPANHSRAILIGFDSRSPVTAALVANTVADLYQQGQVEAKVEATKAATQWLATHVAQLREKSEDAHVAVEQYREDHGLVGGKDTTLLVQEISDVNAQLVLERSKLDDAQARLSHLMNASKTQAMDSVSDVVDSQHIQILRQRQAALTQRFADLATEFGPKHPAVIGTTAELNAAQANIQREIERIGEGIAGEVSRHEAYVARLTSRLEELKTLVARQGEAAVRLSALDREASANETLYLTFLSRMKETDLQAGIQQPDTQIISRADPPLYPAFPHKRLLLLLDLLTSGILSAAALLAFDKRSTATLVMRQTEDLAGLKSLGLVPVVKSLRRISDAPSIYMHHQVRSVFGEAIRTLHVRLLLSSARPPKVVMVASALPNEGKSSTSIALALLMASIGNRVLIVDCDSRRPQLHNVFGLSRAPGLTDYLTGGLTAAEVIRSDQSHSVDVITAGADTSHPAQLFRSERMSALRKALVEAYDVVILDTPPVMVVSDALVLAGLAEKTVFLVRWARTPQDIAERAIQLLCDAGADMAGTVLSMVDLQQMTRGEASESYRRSVRKYYHG